MQLNVFYFWELGTVASNFVRSNDQILIFQGKKTNLE